MKTLTSLLLVETNFKLSICIRLLNCCCCTSVLFIVGVLCTCSAAPRIQDNGSVCVTLCGGQGGTPADGKVRAWNDSWQVVAAAAYSHLVLSHMWPFVVTDYEDYGCTGFRLVFL